jgi:hypothetical protein
VQQFKAFPPNDSADFVHLSVVSTPWFAFSNALLALYIMCMAKEFSQPVSQISRFLMTSVRVCGGYCLSTASASDLLWTGLLWQVWPVATVQRFKAVQRNDSADFVHLSVVSTP